MFLLDSAQCEPRPQIDLRLLPVQILEELVKDLSEYIPRSPLAEREGLLNAMIEINRELNHRGKPATVVNYKEKD